MGTWVQVMSVWGNGFQIAKIDGPRIFMSEGREDVDITGFEGNIVISLSIVGAGGGTRTHTLSPAADFESATSTNSITPAGARESYHVLSKNARVNRPLFPKNFLVRSPNPSRIR